MADKTINDLTATSSLNDGDLFEIENAGNNSRKITAANLRAYGVLAADAANIASTATTSEETLKTYTLPGNTLNVDNQFIRLNAGGALAATTRSRQIKLVVGGVTIVTLASTSASAIAWRLEATIGRRNSGAAIVHASLSMGGVGSIIVHDLGSQLASIDLTAGQAIQIKSTVGVGAQASDTGCNTFLIARA